MLVAMTPELDRWLSERLERERVALLTVVIDEVKSLLKEQIWHDARSARARARTVFRQASRLY
jgi:hypothetical protein